MSRRSIRIQPTPSLPLSLPAPCHSTQAQSSQCSDLSQTQISQMSESITMVKWSHHDPIPISPASHFSLRLPQTSVYSTLAAHDAAGVYHLAYHCMCSPKPLRRTLIQSRGSFPFRRRRHDEGCIQNSKNLISKCNKPATNNQQNHQIDRGNLRTSSPKRYTRSSNPVRRTIDTSYQLPLRACPAARVAARMRHIVSLHKNSSWLKINLWSTYVRCDSSCLMRRTHRRNRLQGF